MTIYLANPTALAMANALETAIDAGTAAVIEIYSGTVPVDCDAAVTGTLLASLTCSATAAVVATTGNVARLTFNAIAPDTSADATGTATHFRIKTQTGGTAVLQGSVDTAGADLNLNTVAITLGSQVSVTSGTLDVPE